MVGLLIEIMSIVLRNVMPFIFEHEGVWEGVYRHIDVGGNVLDVHKSRVECVFPEDGEVVYIQKNRFEWDDGRVVTYEFPGILKNDRIYWDTETFSGYGWQVNENLFVLELDRKDDIGSKFYEMIVMDNNKNSRARTWHWFKNGTCFKRTLCDEQKVSR